MCEPISASTAIALAAGAASAAGTAMTAINSQQAAAAQNQASREAAARASAQRRAEMERQDGYSREAQAAWDAQLDRRTATAATDTISDNEGRILADQKQISSGLGTALSGQSRAPEFVQEDIAAGVARGAQDAQRRVAGLARLSGYDAKNSLDAAESNLFGADLGLARAQSRASTRLYGIESQPVDPTIVGGSMGTLGGVLSGAGNLGLRYAGGQGAFGGGAGAGTSKSMTVANK